MAGTCTFILLFLHFTLLGATNPNCTYNSWNLLSCSWFAKNQFIDNNCYISAFTPSPRSVSGACLLPSGMNPRKCKIFLNSQETFTVGSQVNLSVRCYTEGAGNKSVESIVYFPYENLRLDPPMSLEIMPANEGMWNLAWKCHHSSYVTNFREYEVEYKPKSSPQKVAITIPVKQDELFAPLRDLVPDTIYEAKVRVRNQGGIWSRWSQPYHWKTRTKETTGSSFPVKEVVIPCAVCISCMCIILIISRTQDRVKKIFWIGVPDPSRFFDPLISKYGGNFQKWLSSPFSLSSFTLDVPPLDISPVDFKCNKEEPSKPFLPTSAQEVNTDTSKNSFSGFSNKEYFFFQYPSIKEEGSSNSYFTYDNLEQRGFPAMLQDIPLPSPTALEESPLFKEDHLSLPPSTSLGFHNRSFEEDHSPSVLQFFSSTDPLEQQDITDQEQNLESHKAPSNQEIPDDKQVINVCENKEESLDGGNICPETNHHSAANSQNRDIAGGYISLKEIYNRWALIE
ncbi:interleukin-2 receptor subunit beta [Xenopus laevis]|uniref:Fibronectin type-III domain-containing protein n=2 Tax=Xenopus laevis TaxID=8355 RepID=A0A974D055_XENLA|nr:interleukin-2 receptor subunit beta [Xenopus laevis]OCT83183.1 hypothetical protein XELAEV_18025720mg [Xenopus laevis]